MFILAYNVFNQVDGFVDCLKIILFNHGFKAKKKIKHDNFTFTSCVHIFGDIH